MARHDDVGLLAYHAEFGPARILNREGDHLTVELFISPWARRTISSPKSKISRLVLQEQTRVYFQQRGQWRVARVLVGDTAADGGYEYQLQLPNRVRASYHERDLWVRCWLPHDDPTSALACGGMETQFFHERRVALGKELVEQRAACRGLTGILSARVELVPHQIDVARRVLEDPLQRYLLADEVGMGKTIEAGFIVRQYLLTELDGRVIVVVPPALLEQWRRELHEKFCIDQFANRVELRASDDPDLGATVAPGLLIVDEAHHLVSGDVPGWLVSWSSEAQRLLLLSATPTLRDPAVLLRLLRLLDPMSYQTVALAEFQARLVRQDDFGVFVRGLRVDASPALIRQRLRRIDDLFPGDEVVLACRDTIAHAMEQQDSRALALEMTRLRSHVADVYRIHHRLIRSRRRDCPDWVFRPRGKSPSPQGEVDTSHLRSSWIEDSRLEFCFELLEEWRVEAVAFVSTDASERREVRDIYCSLFEAMACGIESFALAVSLVPSRWMLDATKAEFEKAILPRGETAVPRPAQLAEHIKRQIAGIQRTRPGHRPKFALFGSDGGDLDGCARALTKLFGSRAVLDARSFGPSDNVGEMFRSSPDALFLLCCRAHEEGLNLHFADALVHLDLPLSPQRIEQRIGRLDRFGRSHDDVEQRFLFPAIDEDRCPWLAWFDLLVHGFQVFNVSIADVQFVLNETVEMARDALFEQGAVGLKALIAPIRERLDTERSALDDQYALDRVLQAEDEAHCFFEQIEDADAREDEMATAVHEWLAHAMQFGAERHGPRTSSYRWEDGYTQLPVMPWKRMFSSALNQPVSASRKAVCLPTNGRRSQLLRLGSPLLLAMERHFLWEDRGVAFATWRIAPGTSFHDFLAFQLTYLVEARPPKGLTPAEFASWRARLDGVLPPSQDVIHVDSELHPIRDSFILELLQGRYRTRENNGNDYNLGSRLDGLYAVIDAAQFESLCRSVRAQSEAMLRASTGFQERMQQAKERGNAKLLQGIHRLRQRHARTDSADVRMDLEREIEIHESARRMLDDPVIRLDAIGVFVISDRPPQGPSDRSMSA
ncbi:protein DpdE [Paraburkholderia sp. J7]|uniref:protein DpdE n=1 Tax=Paraburkholderia sp. J7 TaxID=2805438 RepID=UPI002AB63E61|nr:protein DpdE [Paraburkholderia sp. J7]